MTVKETTIIKEDLFMEESISISDPAKVVVILHEKKLIILEHLIKKAMTIQDLRKITGMNPGTIKRHLKDLLANGLVKVARTIKNDYNITMTYYRAMAKEFNISIHIPK